MDVMSNDFAGVLAEVRKRCAPLGGGPDVAQLRCSDCGAEFRCWRSKIKTYCADCGAERMRRQMAEAKGRARARWLDRLRAELDDLESR